LITDSVLAFQTPAGAGGLGQHAGHVLRALAKLEPNLRLCAPRSPFSQDVVACGDTFVPDPLVAHWRRQYTWFRYLTGRYQLETDKRFGHWLASHLSTKSFGRAYMFTQIARETFALTRRQGAKTILDSPNGHIGDFREQLCRESQTWTGWPYLGHPNAAMVRRVEQEYQLADRIRVSSQWAKRSLVSGGVPDSKIFVVPQSIDVTRFVPGPTVNPSGPLRIVFVGSISLGKGFQYLLKAMSRIGSRHVKLEMVGATGDPWSKRLFARLKRGLNVAHAPGDPVGAYQRGELFVLPTLHDGFGLVVAEAMACGLPVITTDACGASEWLREGESGWIVPRGDEDALVNALEGALTSRTRLTDMGRVARAAALQLSHDAILPMLQARVREAWGLEPAGSIQDRSDLLAHSDKRIPA
jgi:glycosyltransferase involved in cell wall biosynthesis